MEKIHNLKQAKNWFKNNSGPVLCICNQKKFIVKIFAEADNFFRNNGKTPMEIILDDIK